MTTATTTGAAKPYHHQIVKVKRVKDAIGAYCLDCQRVIGDVSGPWHWTKSKWLHENGTESQGKKHKVIMYTLE